VGGRRLTLPPEILEPVRRQFGVPDRVLNVLVAEIGLQRPRILAVVGQLVAARMPQHVRVSFEAEPGHLAGTLDKLGKPLGENGDPRSDSNTNSDAGSGGRW
jgi:hypothetical protein